eukprot:5107970-Pyramimonas_sp.AAC.1
MQPCARPGQRGVSPANACSHALNSLNAARRTPGRAICFRSSINWCLGSGRRCWRRRRAADGEGGGVRGAGGGSAIPPPRGGGALAGHLPAA